MGVIVLALNFVEWLEFSLYLYLAKSVFATTFFPPSNQSLVLTFALFAAAYLARPIGGWLFGRKADLTGRRNPMMHTAGLMGIATLGICLLPDYSHIGILAACLLLVFRIAQGLALGGEINTSAIFLIEHNPNNPLLAGSLVAAFGALGMFVGGAIAAVIQYCSVSWVWRVIFAVVGLASLLISRLRKRLQESPEFNHKKDLSRKELWQHHGRGMLHIAAVGAFVSVMVYMCNIFWLTYASDQKLWSSITCAWIASLAQLGSALLAIPIARFSSKNHAPQLLKLSMFTISITAPVLFYCTSQGFHLGVFLALCGYMLGNGLLCSSLYYFLYQQLPMQYRCRGVSTIWAFAASLGAMALPLAQQTVSGAAGYWIPALIVSIIACIAFIILHEPNGGRETTIKEIPAG
ncbi:MFS transporter [Legionella impletisoli]|uniref:MFS transporter n=1 Tax=Legionella impletisoli TaxID=343510 RepID=A0A917JVQ4_9GAMM|nr:MFS transporter [Legionella impletisoli]